MTSLIYVEFHISSTVRTLPTLCWRVVPVALWPHTFFYTSSVLLTMLLECCLGLLAKWCIILAHRSHQLLRKIRNRPQVSLLLLTARTLCTAEVPCLDVFSPAIPQHMPIFFSATEREEMSVFIRASRCVNTVKIHERTF